MKSGHSRPLACPFIWAPPRIGIQAVRAIRSRTAPTPPIQTPGPTVGRVLPPFSGRAVAPDPVALGAAPPPLPLPHRRGLRRLGPAVRALPRHPPPRHELAERDATRFLSWLAEEGHGSAATQTQAASALVFLYRDVPDRPLGRFEQLVRAKQPRQLPVVLTREEVAAVLAELVGPPRLVCALLYGSGLCLLEALCLR